MKLHKSVARIINDAYKNNQGYKYRAPQKNKLVYTVLIPDIKGYNKPLNCFHNLMYKSVYVNITFPTNGILLKVFKK